MPSNLTQLAGQFIGTMGEDSDERTERSGKREKLFIFDNYDNLLAVTSKYIKAVFKESVEVPKTLTITFPMEDPKAEYLQGGNQVAFRDLKGNFRLFTIREVDDEDDGDADKVVECLPSMQELTDVIIKEKVPQDKEAGHVLGVILKDSRWQVGEVAELGKNSTSFYFTNGYEALEKLIDTWGGEIVDRIEIEGSRIAGRYIDIVNRKGRETGKRSEIGKDIENIRRTVLYYPKTALYGKGSSLEAEDEEGEKTGGYTRKITFRDVVWKKSNNDPVDKPKGQEYVGDEDAREKHGIYDPSTGKMMHRYGNFEDNDEEDSGKLLAKTWEAVQSDKEPKAEYEMTIATFFGITGYEHEQVYLGDSVIARDMDVKPYILIDARITEWKYDVGDPDNGTVTMGNILELEDSNDDLNWVVDKVKDNADNWDKGGGPVTDEKFPDIKPPVPTNVTADGLYQTVMLSWDFDPRVFIASYEVFASQIKGYTPSDKTRVFRGKTGGYTHESDNNEKWYFHVRAVNTHGTPSDYSDEVEASTAKINFDDIEEDNIPNFIEYSVYTGDTAPDPDDYKYWIDTSEDQLIMYRWNEDTEEWDALAPTNPKDIGAVEIEEYTDKINEIVSDLEEKAGLEWVDGELKDKVSQKDHEKDIRDILEDLADKVDGEWVDGKLHNKLDKDSFEDRMEKVSKDISDKADFEWVDGELKDKVGNSEFDSIKEDISSKVDGEWVDGRLKSKADKDNTYTIEDVDDALDNKVSSSEYKTDKDGFVERFEEDESKIQQNADEIKTKVSSTEYEELENTVDKHSTSIKQNADEIKSKASSKSVDTLTGEVEDNESSIKQNSEEITSKVSKIDYDKDQDDTVERFKDNESSIKQNAEEIESKVSQTDYDALKETVSTNETSIKQNAEDIELKASQEDLDSTDKSVKDNAASIKVNAEEIESKVDSKEFSDLSDDVKQAESSIKQNADSIKSKVDETSYKEDKDGIMSDIESNSSSIEQNADSIKSKVEQVDIDDAVNSINIGGRNLLRYTDFSMESNADKWVKIGVVDDYSMAKYDGFNVARFRIKDGEKGQNARVRTAYKTRMEKGEEYTLSWIGSSSDYVDSDFSYTWVLIRGKTDQKIAKYITKTKIGEDEILGYDKEIYLYQATFTFERPSTDEASIMFGSEVLKDSSPWYAIGYAKLEKGNKRTDYSPAYEDTREELDEADRAIETNSTEIEQNAEEISSKASKSSLDTISGKVSDNHSEIRQNSNEISQRVSKVDYKKDQEDVVRDLKSQSSRITQTEKDIKSKVDETSYSSDKNSMKKDIKNNTTEIEQNAKEIKSKVSESEYKSDKKGVTSDISDNSSEIKQNAKAIKSKVDEKYVDGEIGKISIGGRNIIPSSDFSKENSLDVWYKWGNTDEIKTSSVEGYTFLRVNSKDINEDSYFNVRTYYRDDLNMKVGETFTLSWIGVHSSGTRFNRAFLSKRVNGNNASKLQSLKNNVVSEEVLFSADVYGYKKNFIKYIVTFDVSDTYSNEEIDELSIRWQYQAARDGATWALITQPKLERGNKASDWERSPNDVESDIESVREYSSEIEQTAKGIKSSVTSLENNVENNSSSIKEAKSEIKQNSDSIKSKVESSDIETAINEIEVGGRNLLPHSDFSNKDDLDYWYVWGNTKDKGISQKSRFGLKFLRFAVNKDTKKDDYLNVRTNWQKMDLKKGTTYTLTWWDRRSNSIDQIKAAIRTRDEDNTSKPIQWLRDVDMVEKKTVKDSTGTGVLRKRKVVFELEDSETEFYIRFQYRANKDTSSGWIYILNPQLEKGNKDTDWSPNPDDTIARVSEAESEIKQNADSITSRVKKNGVISSVNQTAESITIDADRLNVKGDLNVKGGNLRIQNSIITNKMIAGNAKIDAAKIADFSANKITSGTINTDKITIKGGGSKNYTRITGSFVESYGKHKRNWGSSSSKDTVRLKMENGQFRARNEDEDWSVYYNDKGISTFNNATGTGGSSASGFIEFHARDYSPSHKHSGLTLGSIAGRLALQTSGSNLILNPMGGTVYVQDKTAIGSGEYYDLRADKIYATAIRQHPSGNWKGKHLYLGVSGSNNAEVRVTNLNLGSGSIGYRPIKAKDFKQKSEAVSKQDITVWEESAINLIKQAVIYDFRWIDDVKNEGEDADYKQGVVIGEGYKCPGEAVEVDLNDDEVTTDESISLYRMNAWAWKAIQELSEKATRRKEENKALHERIAQLELMMHEYLGGK